MNQHLSQEQFSEWIIGSRDIQAEQHLTVCETCRSELAAFESALGEFRGAVHNWAESEDRPLPFHAPKKRSLARSAFRSPMWAYSAAAVMVTCLLLILVLGRRSAEPTQGASISDAALWSEIDRETSATVPLAFGSLERSFVRNTVVTRPNSTRQQ